MRDVETTANLVDFDTFEPGNSVTAVLPRREIEEAVQQGDSLELWFDLAHADDEERAHVSIALQSEDVLEALRLSSDDELVLALDASELAGLYGDPDVEAHGMRGALAIAVIAGAIAAPAGLAATPQVAGSAVKPQVARTALKPELAHTALKPEVAHTALKPQVARTALKQQVAARDVTRQVSRLVVTAAGVNVWR